MEQKSLISKETGEYSKFKNYTLKIKKTTIKTKNQKLT